MEVLVLVLAMTGMGFAFVSRKASHWSTLVTGLFGFLVFGLGVGFAVMGWFTGCLYLGIGILATGIWIVSKVRNRKLVLKEVKLK